MQVDRLYKNPCIRGVDCSSAGFHWYELPQLFELPMLNKVLFHFLWMMVHGKSLFSSLKSKGNRNAVVFTAITTTSYFVIFPIIAGPSRGRGTSLHPEVLSSYNRAHDTVGPWQGKADRPLITALFNMALLNMGPIWFLLYDYVCWTLCTV